MEAARPTVVAVKRVLGGDVMQVLLPKPSVALLRERVAAATKASKADVMLFNYGRELVDDDDAAAMALPDARIPLALVVRTDSTGPTSLAFRWDASKPAPGVSFEDDRTVVSKSGGPDVNVILSDASWTSGRLEFKVKVHAKNDEMWIGITDRRNLFRITGSEIRNHARTWAYYDGSRGLAFQTGGSTTDPAPAGYGSGDTVGVQVDFDACTMTIFKNGVRQSVCSTLPSASGPRKAFFAFVTLDEVRDRVQLVSATAEA